MSFAIVGIGCILPGGINSPQALWDFLCRGGDAITEVPPDRWNLDLVYDRDPGIPGKAVTRWGAFVSDIGAFDAGFFGISPREAAVMDPQQRLLLEAAWRAFEDAGAPLDKVAGSRTGVYVGISHSDYHEIQKFGRYEIDLHTSTGGALSIAANRLSHRFDLRGPSLSIDTACSSSLVALDLACSALRAGECDMALVGGVNAILTPDVTITFSRASMLSPDGRCKAFDARANGYVRGEGAGVVLLKPLPSALADGDRIYAVVRSTAVNQDGRTTTITVPSLDAQVSMLREVCRRAAIDPAEVRYVEAHGTGTPVGDPIEAEAIGTVFGARATGGAGCLFGSIKTNIGHLEPAAGIASLIKTALCVERGRIPANINFESINPRIRAAEWGIEVCRELADFPATDGSRLAVVNSFGFGGTNACAVVQAPPIRAPQRAAKHGAAFYPCLLPMSAATPAALRRHAGEIADRVATGGVVLKDIAGTLALRRTHLDHRAVAILRTDQDAVKPLRALADERPDGAIKIGRRGGSPRIAFVFSGQGAQWWGMGRALLHGDAVFRSALEECDAAFRKLAGWSLIEELRRGSESSRMDETAVAQPATFALQVALAARWRAWGIEPEAVIGHSIGEIAASHAAGILSLDDATHVVYHRSRLQEGARFKGGMAAIGLPAEEVRRLIHNEHLGLEIAAVNAPEFVTVGGDRTELDRLLQIVTAKGGALARPLHVDYAFHTRQMNPFEDELRRSLASILPHRPHVPMFSTVTGKEVAARELNADYWWRNVREPVLFRAAVEAAVDAGFNTFVELGAHPVLAAPIRSCLSHRGGNGTVVGSLNREQADDTSMANALAELFVAGVGLDWAGIVSPGWNLVELPPQPFEKSLYWAEAEESRSARFDGPAHPLLGFLLKTSMPRWQNHVGPLMPRFLRDHRVDGTVVFPASGYVELMLAAARETLGEMPWEIESIVFHDALVLSPDSLTVIETSIDPARGSIEIASRPRASQAAWTRRASGRVRAWSGSRAPLKIWRPKIAPPAHVEQARFYRTLRHEGHDFGPAFRGVHTLWREHGEALGLVSLPAEAGTADQYLLHPALLDACFHVIRGFEAIDGEMTDDIAVTLPFAIDRIRLFDRPGATLYSRATAVEETPAGIVCDLSIIDEFGRMVASIEGFRCRRMRRSDERAVRAGAALYQESWIELPPEPAPMPNAGDTWLLLADRTGVAAELARLIEAHGGWALLVHDGGLGRDGFEKILQGTSVNRIVHLWSLDVGRGKLDADWIRGAQERGVEALVALVQAVTRQGSTCEIAAVTQGAVRREGDGEPAGLLDAALIGAARTIRNEHPELRLRFVDIAAATSSEAMLAELLLEDTEPEVLLRGDARLGRRLVALEEDALSPRQMAWDAAAHTPSFALAMTAPGVIDNLVLRERPAACPGKGEVLIEVHAAGLNFRDIMAATGLLPAEAEEVPAWQRLGFECAGIVRQLGEGVDAALLGCRVVALAPGSFASHLVAKAQLVFPIGDGLSFTDAAALPTAYVTAHYALVTQARIRAGETVLIHTAAGGVGLAACAVARAAGARIIATAGSEEKRDYLCRQGIEHVFDSRSLGFADDVLAATDGRGVDIVLNSLSGAFLEKSLSLLAPGGRFLEIGKRDIYADSTIGLKSFRQNAAFFAIDLARIAAEHPERLRAEAETVLADLQSGQLAPLPVERFGLGDCHAAFRRMARAKHVGKIVVAFDAPAAVEVNGSITPIVRRDGAYLVTGGLSGFGLAAARWLIEQGARSLVLVGRSGAASPEAMAALEEMRGAGADVLALAADVSEREQVRDVLARIGDGDMPLRGIIHAAGVIDDALVADLDNARIRRVFEPKALGAWHLHELTGAAPLDFFVCVSSVAATLGSVGQAHYAAANAVLDHLAALRGARGAPALSVAFGPIADVGFLARRPDVARYLEQIGLRPVSSREALDALGRLMRRQCDRVVLADISWSALARANPAISASPWLSALIDSSAQEGQSTGSLRARLLTLPAAARLDLIRGLVRGQIAAVLKAAPESVELTRPLTELGLDSLTAFELKNRVETALGVALPIGKFLQRPTAEDLAIAAAEKLDEPEGPSIELVDDGRSAEPAMSIGQQALWFVDQFAPGSPAYGLAMCISVQPKLDPDVLDEAFHRVVARHDSLRHSFPADMAGPVPVLLDASAFRLLRHDIADWDDDAFRRELDREGNRPFDLGGDPLMRLHLYRRSECDVLLLHVHHIIADAASIVICVEQMFEAYFALLAGAPARWSGRVLPASTYARWQAGIAEGAAAAAHVAFWRAALEGAPAMLTLPTDLQRPAQQRGPGASQNILIPRELGRRLKALAAREGQTLFAVLLSAFNVLLHQLGGDTDIVVGTPTLGRVRPDFADAIGYFVNPVPIRTRLSSAAEFKSVLNEVGSTVRAALEHQEFPFAQIVRSLDIARDPASSPIFQVMFAMERPSDLDSHGFAATLLNTEGAEIEINGYKIMSLPMKRDRAQFDLAFVMEEFEDQILGVIDYRTDLWQPATVEGFADRFQSILAAVAGAAELTIRDLAPRQHHGSVLAGPSVQEFPDLMDAIHAAVLARPGRIAVESGHETWTYRQLAERVEVVAALLAGRGVGAQSLVAVCLPRSADMLAAILGVLEVGAAYLPLDRSHPPARLANVLAGTAPSLVLAGAGDTELLSSLAQCPVITLADASRPGFARLARLGKALHRSELAYVIHTSGSTGVPLGVEVRREAVSNLLAAIALELPLSDDDTLLAVTTIAFDIAVLELLLPLTLGSKVVIADEEMARDGKRLAERLAGGDITAMQATPATWQMLLDAQWGGTAGFKALVGGERLQRPLANRLLERVGGLWNLYGPTETTIWSTCAQVFAESTAVSIGRPIANTTCYVVDDHLQPVLPGATGELMIGGSGVAVGYLGHPELTQARFVADPSDPEGRARCFRTGDYVRIDNDVLVYVGRRDQQIKLRGFRIDLAEVESVLASHPGVREVAAVARDGDLATARVAAFVTCHPDAGADEETLAAFLRQRLPGYMVPASITPLPKLPRLSNGKIDRLRLTTMPPGLGRARVVVDPQNESEAKLVALLKETLGLDVLGAEDDFFLAGGTSLLAMRYLARVREVFQIDVGPADLMRAPTAAAMAQLIAQRSIRTGEELVAEPVPEASARVLWRPLAVIRAEAAVAAIDAAAIAYLPDDVISLAAGRAQQIRLEKSASEPYWMGLCRAPAGNIALIVAPLQASDLFADAERSRRALNRSLAFAAKLGARCVALTGVIPAATELGQTLDPPAGVALTTGHAATAVAVALTIGSAAQAAGRDLRDEMVCFVGLGAIGTASLRTLLACAEHPRALTLCDLPARSGHLESLAHEIRVTHGFRGDIDIATRKGGLPDKAYQSRFFVGATNVPGVIAIDRLLPGSVVVDDSFPFCFDHEAAMRRIHNAGDILCLAAGSIGLPQTIKWELALPPGVAALLHDRLAAALLPPRDFITGCIFSSLLPAVANLRPTLGAVSAEDCRDHWEGLAGLGVRAAPLHCGSWVATAAYLRRFGAREGRLLDGARVHRVG